MTSQDKYLAFEKLMRKLAQIASGSIAYGTAILAIISLAPGMQLPPAFAALVGGIGVNILSDILLRIANGEEIPNSELLKQLEVATEDLKKTITKDEFFNAFGHLLEKLQDNHREHKAIIQKIESITKEIDLNRIAPLVKIDVNNGSPQISTGENARNIQAQVYIEKQVIQQAPESRKTSQKDKGEILESTDTIDKEKKGNNGAMIRFLDSLDSARFSEQTSYENTRLLSVLYAKAQLFLALAFGDIVVVSENQLFDSQVFLETFYELYQAAKKFDSKIDLPIRVALREDRKDVFDVVESNLNNEKFIFSLWATLNDDMGKRKQWAVFIHNKQIPADNEIPEEEKILLTKLLIALEYFNSKRTVIAETIAPQFIGRINHVLELSDDDIYDLYTGMPRENPERKYLGEDGISAAKEIRDALRKIQENIGVIDSRSKIRRELTGIKEELKEGVIVLTDAIYNQTIGIGTRATLIQSSVFSPKTHKYVKAGYSLSTFVQDTSHNPKRDFTNWEIYALDYFENLEGLHDPERKSQFAVILDDAQKSAPWEKLLEMQKSPSWQASLKRFRDALTRLQSVEKELSRSLPKNRRDILDKERSHLEGQLGKYWSQHTKNINKSIINSFWSLTETEIEFSHPSYQFSIHLSYSFPKIKLDIDQDKDYKIWRNKVSFKGRLDERIDPTR